MSPNQQRRPLPSLLSMSVCDYSVCVSKQENIQFIKENIKKIAGEWHLRSQKDKVRFRYFRDNILPQFENYEVHSVDGVDIKWDLWNEHFIEYYQEVILYIRN